MTEAMARSTRFSYALSGFFHIICRGNNHTILFRDDNDYCEMISRISRFKQEWPFHIYHYCLMPTHIHLLVETEQLSDLSKAYLQIQLSYFHHFKRKYNYSGHLWQSRFRSLPIISEDYLFRCARYIELNPVAAKLVKFPEEFRWNSCWHYLKKLDDPILKLAPWFLAFGETDTERRMNYKKYMHSGLSLDFNDEEKIFESGKFIGDVSPGKQA